MYRVTVQTKPGRPLLAILVLAAVLAMSLLLAWRVTAVRTRPPLLVLEKQLDLDPLPLKIKIADDWDVVPPRLLPANTSVGWMFPIPGRRGTGQLYAGKITTDGFMLPQEAALAVLFRLLPVGAAPMAIELPQRFSRLPPLLVQELHAVVAAARTTQTWRLACMPSPDGTLYFLAVILSGRRVAVAESLTRQILQNAAIVADRLAATVTQNTSELPDCPFELALDQPMLAHVQTLTEPLNVTTLQPAGKDDADDAAWWQVRLTPIVLAPYRSPAQLLTDRLFDYQRYIGPEQFDQVQTVAQAKAYIDKHRQKVDLPGAETVEKIHITCLASWEDDQAVIIEAAARIEHQSKLEQLVNRLLEQIRPGLDEGFFTRAADAGAQLKQTVLRGHKLLKLPQIANGYYLLKFDDKYLGFLLIDVNVVRSQQRDVLLGLDYSHRRVGSQVHRERTKWTFDPDTGRHESYNHQYVLDRAGTPLWEIVNTTVYDPTAAKLARSVSINDQKREARFSPPPSFVPEGLDLLLLKELAFEERPGPNVSALAISTASPNTASLATEFLTPLAGAGSVVAWSDYIGQPALYTFDKEGRWSGLAFPSGLKLLRSSRRRVQRLFGVELARAERFIAAAGADDRLRR